MRPLIAAIQRAKKSFGGNLPDPQPPGLDPRGMRVLLAYLFPALGDALLLAPVVKSLIDRGVAEPVYLLLRKSAARIWKHIDLPVQVDVLPDELVAPGDPREQDREAAERILKRLQKRKLDAAVDLTARSDVDARFWITRSSAEHRFGWLTDTETCESAGLTWGTRDVRHLADRHWCRYCLLPLDPFGVKEAEPSVPFVSDPASDRSAEALYATGPRVLLVPGAASEKKRWDPERFVEIGKFVVEEKRGCVVVVGAPSEGKLVRGITKRIGLDARPYTGKDLGTLLSLVQKANAVVCNDTGPMHIAFACGVPTIALFTWMSPVAWGPLRHDPRFVVLNVGSIETEHDTAWTRLVLHHLQGLLA